MRERRSLRSPRCSTSSKSATHRRRNSITRISNANHPVAARPPGSIKGALDGMLSEMERAAGALSAQNKTGQALRDDEWLAGFAAS